MVEQNYFDWVGNQRQRERVNRNNQWELFSQFGNGHVATDSKSGDDIIVTESAKRTGPWSSSGDIAETPDDNCLLSMHTSKPDRLSAIGKNHGQHNSS